MKIAVWSIGIFLLGSMISTSTSDKKVVDFCSKFKGESLQCSCESLDGYIEYCVAVRYLTDDHGRSKTLINDRIRNLGDETVNVPQRGKLEDRYDIRVIDPAGKVLLSKKEQADALRKAQNNDGPIPPSLDITSQRHDPFRKLSAGESSESEVDVSASYDLKSGEEYKFSFTRKGITNENQRDLNVSSSEFTIKLPK